MTKNPNKAIPYNVSYFYVMNVLIFHLQFGLWISLLSRSQTTINVKKIRLKPFKLPKSSFNFGGFGNNV